MNDVSDVLSDAIITVCNKIVSKAKFDKTYKCRIIRKLSDNQYVVIKDGIEHTVYGRSNYEVEQIVRVLLPQNNWIDAFIVYP